MEREHKGNDKMGKRTGNEGMRWEGEQEGRDMMGKRTGEVVIR